MHAHTTRLGRAIAYTPATGLVIASAGFGGVYAWTTGSRHGPLLGGLAVLMALSLELAKPLAFAQALEALKRWRFLEAIGLAALAAVAIAYSLTAELSLTATLRADATAERAAQGRMAAVATATYSRLEAQLAGLVSARPSAQLRVEIAAIDSMPGIRDESGVACATIDGRVTKAHCPRRAALQAELARADERQRLEGALAAAASDMRNVGAETKPDAGAAALSAYLSLFGVKVGAGLLGELLVLVVVCALEAGSALAALLVRSYVAAAARQPDTARTAADQSAAVQSAGPQVGPRAIQAAQRAIADHLRARGGAVVQSERELADAVKVPRSTTRRALHAMVAAGVLALTTDHGRTAMRLLA